MSRLQKANRFGISLEFISTDLLMSYRSEFAIFDFIFSEIHDFPKFLTGLMILSENQAVGTLFGRNPLKMDTNIIDFPEIASSLEGRSSMMTERF